MGPLGIITRILAGRYGAPFTFASAAAGAEAAPGPDPGAPSWPTSTACARSRPATRVYGVLGSDVTRSLSPVLHNRAFAARGLDAVYVPLQAEALEPFVAALPALGLAGFSVTRPTRPTSCRTCRRSRRPRPCAAASTPSSCTTALLQRLDHRRPRRARRPLKKRIDAQGQERRDPRRRRRRAGRGPGPRAQGRAGHGAGPRRRPRRAAVGRRRRLRARPPGRPREPRLGRAHQRDARRLGALPRTRPRCPRSCTAPGAVVFDMVYDPLETRLLREAKAAGCTIVGRPRDAAGPGRGAVRDLDRARGAVEVMKSAALVPGAGGGAVSRYSRQELFAGIGPEGQERIRAVARRCVVGCGALGSVARRDDGARRGRRADRRGPRLRRGVEPAAAVALRRGGRGARPAQGRGRRGEAAAHQLRGRGARRRGRPLGRERRRAAARAPTSSSTAPTTSRPASC